MRLCTCGMRMREIQTLKMAVVTKVFIFFLGLSLLIGGVYNRPQVGVFIYLSNKVAITTFPVRQLAAVVGRRKRPHVRRRCRGGGADVARVAGCSSRGAGYLRKGPVVGTWNQGGEKERQARPHFYKRSEAYILSVFIAGPSHVPYRSLRFLMPVIARWVKRHQISFVNANHNYSLGPVCTSCWLRSRGGPFVVP